MMYSIMHSPAGFHHHFSVSRKPYLASRYAKHLSALFCRLAGLNAPEKLLVAATIDMADSTLDLSFGANQSGSAMLVIRATDSGTLSVEDTVMVTLVPESVIPKRFALYQNAPNPFNATTTIHFDIALAGLVELRIYDVSGRLVRKLVNQEMLPARHMVEWDGRDDRGSPVTSGVYFHRLIAADFTATKKMVFLK